MFPWVCRIRKELLYHLPAHFPGHWMQSLIWQILLLTVFFSSDFTDSPAFPENLVRGGRMSTLLLLFLQQAKHCISLQNLSDKVGFCDSPHSLWPALSCGRRGGPWARSPVQGNAGTSWKHRACLGYSPALGMSQRPCTGARHLSLGGGDAQGNQQKGLLFRGMASLWLWPHETFFWRCVFTSREPPPVLLMLLSFLLALFVVQGMPLMLGHCRRGLWSFSDSCVPLIKQYIVLIINVGLIYSLEHWQTEKGKRQAVPSQRIMGD